MERKLGRWTSKMGREPYEYPVDKNEGPIGCGFQPSLWRDWPQDCGDAGVSNPYRLGGEIHHLKLNPDFSAVDCRLLCNIAPPPLFYPPLCLTPLSSDASDFSSWVLWSFAHRRTLTLIVTYTWNTQPWDLCRVHSFTSFMFLLKRSSSIQPSSTLPLLPHTASFSPSHYDLRLQLYVYGLSFPPDCEPPSKQSFCPSCSPSNSLHRDSAWHICVEWTIEFKESMASAITRILYQRISGLFQFWDKLLEVSQPCENVISL